MKIGVIGGGIYGSSVSYFLKKLGSNKNEVYLFEKNNIGGISTSKSSGMVRHHYSNKIHTEFAKRGIEILENLKNTTDNNIGFYQNGFLIMAGEKTETQFRKNIDMHRSLGIEVELIYPSKLPELVPKINNKEITIAALEKKGGFADPYSVARLFAKKAESIGVRIKTNTPIVNIESKNKEIKSVKTKNTVYDVDFLINASGPCSKSISQMVGLDLPLKIYEAKIVVLSSETRSNNDIPVVFDLERGQYLKPEPSGNFISGGFKSANISNEDIKNINNLSDVTQKELLQVYEFLNERLPEYSDAEVIDSWTGVITASPDWHQIIGIPENYKNFYLVVGASGHGFKEAPGFAESIAQSILDKKPNNDVSPYRLRRFKENKEFNKGYGENIQSWIC